MQIVYFFFKLRCFLNITDKYGLSVVSPFDISMSATFEGGMF